MKPRVIVLLAAVLVFGVAAWIWLGSDLAGTPDPADHPRTGTPVARENTPAPAVAPAPVESVPAPPPPVRTASAVMPGTPLVRTTPTPQPLNAVAAVRTVPVSHADRAVEGKVELEQVRTMLRDFRTRLGQNPIGSNAEIMKAIMGGNEVRARLGPPPGQEVNEQGELLDRWGKPYFFHQLSRDSMEIRSAGPDGRMWTVDDLVTK
ncbi:MAG: hypothetical protein ABIP85_23300 [Chthoniobacteraceae bacterium]